VMFGSDVAPPGDATLPSDGWLVVDASPPPREAGPDTLVMDASHGGGDASSDASSDAASGDANDDATGGVIRCTGGGACPAFQQCLMCPLGALTGISFCTTPCSDSSECTDPTLPHCAVDPIRMMGLCVPPGLACLFDVVCAAPDTMIATPSGERAIADLQVGDLVYSADDGALTIVPLAAVHRTPVDDHRVVRLTLETGRVLEISPGHPTADGRFFGELRAGDRLDGTLVLSAELVPYAHDATYDILPSSDTGTYVAGGALIGSTLSGVGAPIALAAP